MRMRLKSISSCTGCWVLHILFQLIYVFIAYCLRYFRIAPMRVLLFIFSWLIVKYNSKLGNKKFGHSLWLIWTILSLWDLQLAANIQIKKKCTFYYWFVVAFVLLTTKKMNRKLTALDSFENWTVENRSMDSTRLILKLFFSFGWINFWWFFNQTDMSLTHAASKYVQLSTLLLVGDGCVHVAGHVMKINSQYWIWTFSFTFTLSIRQWMHFRYFNQYIFHSIRLDHVFV